MLCRLTVWFPSILIALLFATDAQAQASRRIAKPGNAQNDAQSGREFQAQPLDDLKTDQLQRKLEQFERAAEVDENKLTIFEHISEGLAGWIALMTVVVTVAGVITFISVRERTQNLVDQATKETRAAISRRS